MGNRVKDNEEILSMIIKNEKEKGTRGTRDELICWNLGTISTLLADISRSLAVIADHLDKEDKVE